MGCGRGGKQTNQAAAQLFTTKLSSSTKNEDLLSQLDDKLLNGEVTTEEYDKIKEYLANK